MTNDSDKGKTIAIYSYVTIIGTLVAMLNNTNPKSEFAAFHIRQALGLNIAFYGLGYIVSNFDSWTVTAAFYIFFITLWTFGFVSAIQGKMAAIPLLGPLFQKVFKTL